MTVSYGIYLFSFSSEEEIVGDRGQHGGGRKRQTSDGDSWLDAVISIKCL